MTYWYCGIKVKGIHQTYSYINDMGELDVGTFVEVPFGRYNAPKIGVVESCGEYAEDKTPFPVEKTKHINRIASSDEYEEQDPVKPYGYDEDEDIDEVDYYIEEEDWDEVLEWAIDHHDCTLEGILEKVVQCYDLCVEQNMPTAALNLGTLYYTGRGVEQDYGKALHLYQIAASGGELRAICNLGYCYYYGRDCEVDYTRAYQYYEIGALLYNDVNCLYKLGDMYLNGYHVGMNNKYAFMLYSRAFESLKDSDADCLADIQFRLGKCLLRGIGVAKDVERANTYLHSALLNFYKRRKTDPFVGGLIRSTKEYIDEAEELLEKDIL